MREIPDPFTDEAHPCHTGSCLPVADSDVNCVHCEDDKQIANFEAVVHDTAAVQSKQEH